MKKLISILVAIFILLSCSILIGCDNDEDSSERESSESESESESEAVQDPADVVDPDAPEDVEIEPFSTQSDYVIVYEEGDSALQALAQSFADYIKTEYEITLAVRSNDKAENEHEIIFGASRYNARYIVNKLYEVNDFAISVCGDDLVFYATGERLYDYMLNIAMDIFDGESTAFSPDQSFIYHKSEYKDIAYAGYIDEKNDSVKYEDLLYLFEARTFTAEDGTTLPYRIYIPSGYNEQQEFPVVTILHGAGERGSDNEAQLKNMVPYLFSQPDSPFWDAIVICPQCPAWPNQWVDTPWADGNYSIDEVAQSNELAAVVELLSSTENELSVDTNRYYVMGLSMGGFGTWDLIMRHKEMFAGAVALCGGADESKASLLVDFPVWALHGGSDPTVPYSGTSDMVSAIKAAVKAEGADEVLKWTPLGGYGHNIWDYVGANTAISKWLFEQNLSNRGK